MAFISRKPIQVLSKRYITVSRYTVPKYHPYGDKQETPKASKIQEMKLEAREFRSRL